MPYAPYSTYNYTPAGTQLAQGFNQAGAMAKLMNNQTISPEEVATANAGYEKANQLVVSETTPQARADVLTGTNFGQTQQDYSALAQRLAAYDNIVLKPEFAGTSSGMPTDLPVNPDVTFGNVSYITPGNANLPANQGIYNANPAYALSAQASEQGNILDLLNTLNEVMGKELGRGKDIYASRLKTATTALAGLGDILKMNADLEEGRLDRELREKELAENRAQRTQTKSEQADRDFYAAITQGVTELQTGEDWGTVWNRVKSRFPHRADYEIDTALGTAWREPKAYEEYIGKQTSAKATAKAADDQDFMDVSNGLDNYLGRRKGSSFWQRANPFDPTGIAVETEKQTLSRILAKLVEKNRISDKDAQFYINQLPPAWMDDAQAQAKIDGIKNGLAAKLGVAINTQSGGSDWQ